MLPEFRNENGNYEFIVDDKPFMMLCGELHNSAASSSRYMEKEVWPRLRNMHLNSILLPVYWEQIEPSEGSFDFHIIDEIIMQARGEKIRLGILWFGLWKNGISSYVPSWMKTDGQRFFRAKDRNRKNMDVISPFCDEAVEKDKSAFAKLMSHIKKVDEKEQTVILVQVENEIGLLGSDRDYSDCADQLFNETVPTEIAGLYDKSIGTWTEVFGEEAPEVFMEYGYASAIEKIASSGKKI